MNERIAIIAGVRSPFVKSGTEGIDMGTTGTILLNTGTTQPAFISLEPYSNQGSSKIIIISLFLVAPPVCSTFFVSEKCIFLIAPAKTVVPVFFPGSSVPSQ